MKPTRETREILDTLESQHPGADTELHFKTAFELLVATILSAQSTDAGVNLATPALFARYPDARALASAKHADVEPLIHSTGFFRAKARSIIGMAQALVESHDGEVPATMEALVALPGVGRKTANVVLGHALGIPGLPVDRHVLRVSNRIGIAESDDPIVVEQQLCEAMPPERWTRTSDTLILHGRRICRPKPLCDQCFVRDECDYYRTVVIPERDGRTHGSAPTKKGKVQPSTKSRAVGANLRVRLDPRRGKKSSKARRTSKRAPSPVGADPRVRPKKAVAKRRVRKARR
jgi:endonuclease-3